MRPPRPRTRWRARPATLVRLIVGLCIFGAGEAFLVLAALGNSPWTVFAEGLATVTPMTVGQATIAIGVGVLCLWIPLKERPGLGTLANAVVVGLAIDAVLIVVPAPDLLVIRGATVVAGVLLVGLGSGLYLSCDLGPGPRDGLMTGIVRKTGWPLPVVRTGIEVSALVAGVLLGGTAGIGTVAFALGVGPAVGLGLRVVGANDRRREAIQGEAS